MEPQHGRRHEHVGTGAAITASVPLESLFTGLRRVLNDADASHLPDLLGKLESERLRAEVRLRRLTSAGALAPAEEPVGDELLTLPQVAAFLGVPEDYAYSLARQRKIPTVRLPGLDRGGRTTTGKYVRVRRSALVAWLGVHVDKVLEGGERSAPHSVRRASRVSSPPARVTHTLGPGARRVAPPPDTAAALTAGVVTAGSAPLTARAHAAVETR